jgi:hypothetical protein
MKTAHSRLEDAEEEIRHPTGGTREHHLPVSFLSKYLDVENQVKGKLRWAHFYKCVDFASRPHRLAWGTCQSSQTQVSSEAILGSWSLTEHSSKKMHRPCPI